MSDAPPVEEQEAKDRRIAMANFSRYVAVRDRGHTDYITEANQFDKFYRGDQWSPADKAALEAELRPAMTVNLILSAVNTVRGVYINKQADFRYKPKRNGATTEQAKILNKVAMHIADEGMYSEFEQDMFDDGLILDRGYIDVRINKDDNLYGEVAFRALDPRAVIPDPDGSNYDPSTWRDVITTEYKSIEDIEAEYGKEAAERLYKHIDVDSPYKEDSVQFYDNVTFGDNYGAANGSPYGDLVTEERKRVRSVRVIDRQHYKLGLFKYFVDPVTGDESEVNPKWEEERVQAFAVKFGLSIVAKRQRRIRWTVSADKVLLHDEWSPYKTFTVIPFFPYFRRGHPFGMVRNLINPQEIVNKSTSQELHVINTTANSGWIVETGSLTNMTVDDLQQRGSKSGLVIEVAPGKKAPEKIQPNSVPTGLDRVTNQSSNAVFEISGVNRSLVGQETAALSGVSINERKSSGLAQLDPVFKNLARTRKLVGKKIIELVQKFYTDQRVFMIADFKNPNDELQPLEVNKPVFDHGTRQFTVVNDLSLGEYGVAIGTMPARDVYNEQQFAEAISLKTAGVPVPDYHIVKFSNLDDKDEIAYELQQAAGLAPPSEQELAIQKTQEEIQAVLTQMEVQEKAAQIALTKANAALANAKAESTTDAPSLEREKMQLEAQITAIEQGTRERVARLKELTNQVNNLSTNQHKLEMEKRKAMSNLAVETLKQTSKQQAPHGGEKNERKPGNTNI